ncbi:MAG: hypothetical protein KF773_02970 [Deltaproteobacteria bacterium]|nr:hypothetical protein [Deltaproteobacteria bacterium]
MQDEDAVNADVRVLFMDGERAARRGEVATARACFLEAGQAAADVQLWRSAIRCYRHVLELDLLDREPVERIGRMPNRVISGRGWDAYRAAIDQHARWPHFGCRGAQIVIGDLGAVIDCPGVGPVLELIMTDKDLIETRPDARFNGMPIAMAMILLRRAMWPAPRERATEPMNVRVTYAGRERVRLDEHGDWDPIVGESRR